MRGRFGVGLGVLSLLGGCGKVCGQEGFEYFEELGGCVRVDEPDDTDTQLPVHTGDTAEFDQTSVVRLQWSTTVLPNHNIVQLDCDGRRMLRERNFTFIAEHSREFAVLPGVSCTVTLRDRVGGLLPAGSFSVCSKEVASWEAQRGLEATFGPFTAEVCVPGCVDPIAENFDPSANHDDGSCRYILGCTDPEARNYAPGATKDDGSCDYGGVGVLEIDVFTDATPTENIVRLVCDGYEVLRLAPSIAWTTERIVHIVEPGHDCEVTIEDKVGDSGPAGAVRVCGEVVLTWPRTPERGRPYTVSVGKVPLRACSGCTDPHSPDYDPDALWPDGSCTYP